MNTPVATGPIVVGLMSTPKGTPHCDTPVTRHCYESFPWSSSTSPKISCNQRTNRQYVRMA